MDYDYEVVKLSDDFYLDYPNDTFQEILKKNERPYNCLLVETNYDYFICIPYRSNLNHKYSFRFRGSERSKKTHSGLDYTKMVLIKNGDYISGAAATVDHDEYKETVQNIKRIVYEAVEYLDCYIKHKTGINVLSSEEYNRRYAKSSLPYFDNILNIDKKRVGSHPR